MPYLHLTLEDLRSSYTRSSNTTFAALANHNGSSCITRLAAFTTTSATTREPGQSDPQPRSCSNTPSHRQISLHFQTDRKSLPHLLAIHKRSKSPQHALHGRKQNLRPNIRHPHPTRHSPQLPNSPPGLRSHALSPQILALSTTPRNSVHAPRRLPAAQSKHSDSARSQ